MIAALACITFVAAIILTIGARQWAVKRKVLDVPNVRSSHTTPTPRGGGIAIVLSSIAAWVFLERHGMLNSNVMLALCGGGLAVALIGLLDDHYHLPASIRLAVHFCAAAWALWCLHGLPALSLGYSAISLGAVGYVLGTLVIVWTLNLFNFMDGIDGIAGSEAAFVAGCGAWLGLSAASGIGPAAIVFSAACLGFLVLNWPPARIFMGDVGSGFLGYVIAVLALASERAVPGEALAWLMLSGAFFVDASVTLLRRSLRGDRVFEAHRTHAYQWLARRWGTHRPVTFLFLAVNLFWLLPAVLLAKTYPEYSLLVFVTAFTPLVVAALMAGSGRSETSKPPTVAN